MTTIASTSFTSSITHTVVAHRQSLKVGSPIAIGLPTMVKKGKLMCSMEKKPSTEKKSSRMDKSAPLMAAAYAATMSSPPAMALVDERLSIEGTGLPFDSSNKFLGWILFGVFGLIWALYFLYTSSLVRLK